MKVYVNAFEIHGTGAESACFRAIHGWLSQQIDADMSLSDLVHPSEWRGTRAGKNSWLKSFISREEHDALYAWRLKHGDDSVPGRQWTVEIGLGCFDNHVRFSCSVQTDEQSTEVTQQVTASRPRLIGYVLDNIEQAEDAEVDPATPGRMSKHIGHSTDDYRALLEEIQNPKRDFPLVLVSPRREGGYLINPDHLQNQLFGLAQVVEVVDKFDSYEMEEVLGRHWSAWDGAVNVIRTRHPSGKIIGTPILSEQILCQGDTQRERIAHVLGKVTHNTNVPRLRMQINADGVLQRALRSRFHARLSALRDETKAGGSEQVDELLNDMVKFEEEQSRLTVERDQLEMSLMQSEEEKQELEDQIRKSRYLSRYATQNDTNQTPVIEPALRALELIREGAEPTPADALDLIAGAYSDRITVLQTARDSADALKTFQQGRRLFDMLCRLATDFRDALKAQGDSEAKSVFTPNEYAAQESETVLKSREHLRQREFQYKGEMVPMLRHLKIGVADDLSKTVRVHFDWDSEDEKIVIGYCGKHLPIPHH